MSTLSCILRGRTKTRIKNKVFHSIADISKINCIKTCWQKQSSKPWYYIGSCKGVILDFPNGKMLCLLNGIFFANSASLEMERWMIAKYRIETFLPLTLTFLLTKFSFVALIFSIFSLLIWWTLIYLKHNVSKADFQLFLHFAFLMKYILISRSFLRVYSKYIIWLLTMAYICCTFLHLNNMSMHLVCDLVLL